MTQPPRIEPPHVVIVGGGIAALEAVLALRDLAGDRVRVTLIAPEPDFVLRPLAVAAPFSRGHVDRLPLAQVMAEHSGHFVRGAVLRVDAAARIVTLTPDAEIAYDTLVLALGAAAVPAFAHTLTFGEEPLAFSGLLADLEQGSSHSVSFVVPGGCTWPLPLYELALMTAEKVWSTGTDSVRLHLVTHERAPLELFGAAASAAVTDLLRAARITAHLDVSARVERGGRVAIGSAELVVDRVVAMPLLEGRRLAGIPCDADGFIPVDDTGLVEGVDGVYAVGDATDRPVKQGGLACQQADVTAAHIAACAGSGIEVPPLQQVLRGRLLTGKHDRFLRRGSGPDAGAATEEPLWWPPAKVSGKHLSPYLAAKGIVHLPPHADPRRPGVDVRAEVRRKCVPGGVTERTPLRPITPHRPAPPLATHTPIEPGLRG